MGHSTTRGAQGQPVQLSETLAVSPAQHTLEESIKIWSEQEGTQVVGTWQRLCRPGFSSDSREASCPHLGAGPLLSASIAN